MIELSFSPIWGPYTVLPPKGNRLVSGPEEKSWIWKYREPRKSETECDTSECWDVRIIELANERSSFLRDFLCYKLGALINFSANVYGLFLPHAHLYRFFRLALTRAPLQIKNLPQLAVSGEAMDKTRVNVFVKNCHWLWSALQTCIKSTELATYLSVYPHTRPHIHSWQCCIV